MRRAAMLQVMVVVTACAAVLGACSTGNGSRG